MSKVLIVIATAAFFSATAAALAWMPEAWSYFSLYNDPRPLIAAGGEPGSCGPMFAH
ncbi:MAG TPA: hypothetical protein VN326_21380 [Casimicrobiaceae bacterium]|nr:hypothetical protein [Casimicrobiaceae bacterium]